MDNYVHEKCVQVQTKELVEKYNQTKLGKMFRCLLKINIYYFKLF